MSRQKSQRGDAAGPPAVADLPVPDLAVGRREGRRVELRIGDQAVAATVADTWWARARGLLFRPPPASGDGLLLTRCSSVHTWLMRAPIDVAYLDRELVIVKLAPRLRPWRFSWCARGARHTLELAAGEIARLGLQEGARFSAPPGAGIT
ncbi:MAG: DUF192 domain-containing protein [Chloroflexi bacterium]|nr:DUF192 domain-containing protein [Chloroflexota bacterium]